MLLPRPKWERERNPQEPKKKIAENECERITQEIKNLLLKGQEKVKDALKDGPYWARLKKEDIIWDVKIFIEEYEIASDWNSEEATRLRAIESLALNYKEKLLAALSKGGEIAGRMVTENIYYVLECLLGLKEDERPTVRIWNPEGKDIEVHLEDVLKT